VKERRCLVIRHLSMASILALNGCPGLVDHYMDGPLMPAPRSNDGAKGPGATRRDRLRGKRFWLLLSRLTKVTRPGRASPSDRPLGKAALRKRCRPVVIKLPQEKARHKTGLFRRAPKDQLTLASSSPRA